MMDTKLNVVLTQTFDKKPLATIRNLPGKDADMTPSQMRALAQTLLDIAAACEKRPMGKHFIRSERTFEIELGSHAGSGT